VAQPFVRGKKNKKHFIQLFIFFCVGLWCVLTRAPRSNPRELRRW